MSIPAFTIRMQQNNLIMLDHFVCTIQKKKKNTIQLYWKIAPPLLLHKQSCDY